MDTCQEMTARSVPLLHEIKIRAAGVIRSAPDVSSVDREPTAVIVVDDDTVICEALGSLFRSVGLRAELFGTADDVMESGLLKEAGCLVLDVRMPGISGLDFQEQLVKLGVQTPVVIMTGYGDISMSVRAMKAGAIDFLLKPFRSQDMLDAVAAALKAGRLRRKNEKAMRDLRALYQTLTTREKQVMAYATAGLMNKQVAGEIGLSEITLNIHRGNVMKKMQAKSLAHLVRMSEALTLRPTPISGW